jgi:hypothetical protein
MKGTLGNVTWCVEVVTNLNYVTPHKKIFIISALKTANLTPRNMPHLFATGSSSDIAVAKVVTCRPPPRRTGFDSRLVRVPFMVDRVTMRRILFQYLCFPPAIHTHLLMYYQRLAKFSSVEGLPVCHCCQ